MRGRRLVAWFQDNGMTPEESIAIMLRTVSVLIVGLSENRPAMIARLSTSLRDLRETTLDGFREKELGQGRVGDRELGIDKCQPVANEIQTQTQA
jgi:hypothetical protein